MTQYVIATSDTFSHKIQCVVVLMISPEEVRAHVKAQPRVNYQELRPSWLTYLEATDEKGPSAMGSCFLGKEERGTCKSCQKSYSKKCRCGKNQEDGAESSSWKPKGKSSGKNVEHGDAKL